MSPRVLRSLLFVPGDSEKKLGKADGAGADAPILDLEDSVSPAPGSGAVAPDAKMVDMPHLVQAQGLAQTASRAGRS